MRINLHEIHQDNWKALAELAPLTEQNSNTVPNWYAMLEASQRGFTALGIAIDGVWAGLCVYGLDSQVGAYRLYHFMLSAEFQGKGLGQAVLQQVVDTIRTMPNCYHIMVDAAPENEPAKTIFSRLGFVPTQDSEPEKSLWILYTTPLSPPQALTKDEPEKNEINWERILLALIFFLLLLYGSFNIFIPRVGLPAGALG